MFSSFGNFLLNVLGLFAKSKSVVYIVTLCFSLENSLAKSIAKNKMPPNCVAGRDAGHTMPIFIKITLNYTF